MLAVLAGVPPTTAAAQIGTTVADLTESVALYQAAGRTALAEHAASGSWYQVHVEFTDPETAETTMATHLLPLLREAETEDTVSSWWYIRKSPCWRLRFHTGAAGPAAMRTFVANALDSLTGRKLAVRGWPSIYEPETPAFGGPAGIAAAHRLFHNDSRNILDYLRRPTHPPATPIIGRREVSILLCATLMRAANLDWHEQGDVWHRVTRMRPLPPDTTTSTLHVMTIHIRRLLSLDTRPQSSPVHDGRPLAFARTWLGAFTEAGKTLGAAARDGTLRRGLRDILAHHVIFHWNRIGLPDPTQSALANAATAATLSLTGNPPEAGDDVASA